MSEQSTSAIPEAPQASRRGLLLGLMAATALPAAPAIAKVIGPPPVAAPVVAVPAVPIAATVEEVPFLDAKLMKLVDDYLSADDERQRLEEVLHRAAEAQQAKYPMPDVLHVRPEDHEIELPDHRGYYDGLFFDGGNRRDYDDGVWIGVLRRPLWKRLVEYTPPNLEPVCQCEGFDPSPAARARADEIVAAYDEWWPKVRRHTATGIEPRYPRGSGGVAVEKQSKRLEALLSKLEAKINKTRARTFVGILGKAKIASLAATGRRSWRRCWSSSPLPSFASARGGDRLSRDGTGRVRSA
jgi:hypothetical protein